MLINYRYNIIEHLRKNIIAYFFIILVFSIGIIVGALAVKTLPDEQKKELIGYLSIFFNGLTNGFDAGNESSILSSVIYNNVKTIIIMWLLGFTIVGIPFVLFILFTRGFVIGFTVGFLVNEYVMKGILFAITAVIPHNFLAVPATLVTAVAAIKFSLLLLRGRKNKRINLFAQAFNYSIFCAVMLCVMLLASIIEVYASPIFMKLVAGTMIK
ncbi:MAG: stage II sporulation protein M [Pelosinus sp.]|nr:stage II sporulation protein M [Pelosinus sp.]